MFGVPDRVNGTSEREANVVVSIERTVSDQGQAWSFAEKGQGQEWTQPFLCQYDETERLSRQVLHTSLLQVGFD